MNPTITRYRTRRGEWIWDVGYPGARSLKLNDDELKTLIELATEALNGPKPTP